MTRYFRAFALFVATLALVGCATHPPGSPQDDAKAKQFTPAPQKASIYIYRNENLGGLAPLTVKVNNQSIGQTGAMTYFHLTVEPGVYNIESESENTSVISVTAEPAKNYFVWQEMKMGIWAPRTQLSQTDDAAGRKGVMQSRLLATLVPVQPMAAPGAAPAANTTADKLRQLQKMYEEKLISADEYEAKRKQILSGF
ncbi:MAG: DUF2846 domain-containing protein [Acidovorax sp.]